MSAKFSCAEKTIINNLHVFDYVNKKCQDKVNLNDNQAKKILFFYNGLVNCYKLVV